MTNTVNDRSFILLLVAGLGNDTIEPSESLSSHVQCTEDLAMNPFPITKSESLPRHVQGLGNDTIEPSESLSRQVVLALLNKHRTIVFALIGGCSDLTQDFNALFTLSYIDFKSISSVSLKFNLYIVATFLKVSTF
jgi:hypothetical protein